MKTNIKNKDEAIKEFLSELLEKFEIERKLTLHEKKILEKQKKPKQNRIGLKIIRLEAINLAINHLKNIQFESLDNFDSVKNIKKAELFFSNTYYLERFKFLENYNFSYCTSQIPPVLVSYVEIEMQLDALDKKAIDLLHRGYKSKGTEISWLDLNLRNLNLWFFIEKRIDYDTYKARALEIILNSRVTLDQHWGYKEILVNLIQLILVIPCFVNKIVTGHFLFFQKPSYSEQLDKLNQSVIQLSL